MVDHDSGRLEWAGKNRNATTLRGFRPACQQRSAQLTHVSADGAQWIHDVVGERAPQALTCLDPFHVVAWASAALDAARRGMWNQLSAAGSKDQAKARKGTRWALLRNPRNQSGGQRTTVAAIATINKPLYRAYLLKNSSGWSLRPKANPAGGCWLAWAQRSRLPEFVQLAKMIKRFLPLIHNTLDHRLSNACPRPRTLTCGY